MTKNILFIFLLLVSLQLKAFVIPPPPTNLTVSEVTQTSFKANWDSSNDVISYWMDLSTSSNFTTGNVFIDRHVHRGEVTEGLTPGTAYYFRVRSTSASGTSANSVIRSLVIIPPTPTITRRETVINNPQVGEGNVKIFWTGSIGSTGYRLDVSTTSTFSTLVYTNLDAGNNTEFVVKNLVPAQGYYVRVRAVNSLGVSPDSAPFSIRADALAPIAIAATNVTSNSFTANWIKRPSSNNYVYKIEIATDVSFQTIYRAFTTTPGASSFDVKESIEPTRYYYYRVTVWDNFESPPSNVSPAVVTPAQVQAQAIALAVPAAPTNLTVSEITGTTFKANWDTPTDVISYWMDLSTSSNFTTGNVFIDRHVHRGEVTEGLKAGTTYYFRVRCVNASGTSANSAIKSFATLPLPLPPTDLKIESVFSFQFSASWTPSAGAISYRWDVSKSSNFSTGNVFIDRPLQEAFGTATNLDAGTTYYFRVRTVNAAGVSANSFIRSLVTLPDAPQFSSFKGAGQVSTITGAILNPGEIEYNWTSRMGATDYRVDVSTSSDFATLVYQNIGAGSRTGIVVKNLPYGFTCWFRVRALNTYGASQYSGAVGYENPFPAPTVLPATNVTSTGFTANWLAPANQPVVVWYVEIAKSPDFRTDFHSYIDYPDTHLDFTTSGPGTYYYRVRWSHYDGTNNIYSYKSSAMAVTVPSSFAANGISIYPNPVSNSESIKVDISGLEPKASVKAEITSLSADQVIQYQFEADENGSVNSSIPASSLKPGTYLLKVNEKVSRFIVN